MGNLLSEYSAMQLACISFCVFLQGMNKGGIPVGPIALPVLILVWPNQMQAARGVVGFMLPLLCVMDIFAMIAYRRHVLWKRVALLLPGALAGVALASLLFLAGNRALVQVSDQCLKFAVGLIGVLFVAYRAGKKWLLSHLPTTTEPGWGRGTILGLATGVTSTLAHAGGPTAQMYFLPQNLDKMNLVGSMVAFFLILNYVKLAPFALCGMLKAPNLVLGAVMLPVIPLGVWAGYLLVRAVKQEAYIGFIYAVLLVTSCMLIVKSFG